MANDRRPPTRPGAMNRLPGLAGAGALLLLVAACTTGSVLSLEPAVDVGSSTASVPRFDQPVPRIEAQPSPSFEPAPQTVAVMRTPGAGLQNSRAVRSLSGRLSPHGPAGRAAGQLSSTGRSRLPARTQTAQGGICRRAADPRGPVRHRPSRQGVGDRQRPDEAGGDAHLRHGAHLRAAGPRTNSFRPRAGATSRASRRSTRGPAIPAARSPTAGACCPSTARATRSTS